MDLAGEQRAFLQALLAPGEPASAGMSTYRRNLRASRHDTLAQAYPVVRRLVGEAFFGEAAERYALATPSRSGDLHAYGGAFAAFLTLYPPASALDYLPDIARLEWAVHECAHAADGDAVDFAVLGRVEPERLPTLRLRLHPAARLVASPHPVLAIWAANQAGHDGTPDPDAGGGECVLVRRDGLDAAPVAITRAEWTLLDAFLQGLPLAEASARLAAMEDLAPALARVAALGALGGFDPP